MKNKILACILSAGLMFTMTGYGTITAAAATPNGSNPASYLVSMPSVRAKAADHLLSQNASIDETVLVDESGVKITATELTCSSYGAELEILIENNSDKQLTFISGSNGYSFNSVNGYMVSGPYVNEDVAPGCKVKATVNFDADELLTLGISDIAEIQLAFQIEDNDYNTILETGPRTIQTSIAESYDYSAESFGSAITDSSVAETEGYTLIHYAEDSQFSSNDLQLLSEAVAENSSGDTILLLEVENIGTEDKIIASSDISINGITVSPGGNWDSISIIAGKKAVMSTNLNNIAEQEYLELAGIDEIAEVAMDLSVYQADRTKLSEGNYISVSIPGREITAAEAGNEVVNSNNVRVLSLGKVDDSASYSDDVHLLFLIENNTASSIYADTGYDGNAVNGFMADAITYGIEVAPGNKGLLDVSISGYDLEDYDITCADDITEAVVALEIRDENYQDLINSSLSITY